MKQGGTAGNVYDPSLTEEDSVMGGFFVIFQSQWRDSPNEQKVSSEGTGALKDYNSLIKEEYRNEDYTHIGRMQ